VRRYALFSGQNLDLAGMAVYGSRGAVDAIVKGARMHP
jgi:hypothetical protein